MAQGRDTDDLFEQLWFGDDNVADAEHQAARSASASAAKSTGLKPFPATALKVLELPRRHEFDPRAVRKAFEGDPAMTTRLLNVANSPLYRGAVAVSSIDQAIVRLGSVTVQDLVAGIASVGLFRDLRGIGAQIREHCVGVGAVAGVLAKRWMFEGAEQAFLCGLMHDMGKLLLLQSREFLYDQLPQDAYTSADHAHLEERRVLGFDHALLGAHALSLWGLPDPVPQVVAAHHSPTRAYKKGGDLALLVALIRVADAVELRIRKAGTSPTHGLEDAWLDALARGDACTYAEFNPHELTDLWPRIVDGRAEMLKAL